MCSAHVVANILCRHCVHWVKSICPSFLNRPFSIINDQLITINHHWSTASLWLRWRETWDRGKKKQETPVWQGVSPGELEKERGGKQKSGRIRSDRGRDEEEILYVSSGVSLRPLYNSLFYTLMPLKVRVHSPGPHSSVCLLSFQHQNHVFSEHFQTHRW